jgi:hypothetical protein
MSYVSRYRSPHDIIQEEIENERTRIPQVISNPLLRNKLSYWKRKQSEERKKKKVSKKSDETLQKLREKEARKIKSKHCVSKYKVTCSNCGQGFRTKKELANHTAYYKKHEKKTGNACYSSNSVNSRLSRVTTEKKKKNMTYDSESCFDEIISDIETIVTMIKDRMKILNNKCEKCRNSFAATALKSMTCNYRHKLCAGCHGGESRCSFCAIHCKISHATDHSLRQADKIREGSTRFKAQTQIQPVPEVCYKTSKSSTPPEEHPNYCNICFEVCRSKLVMLDCGGHHSMCASCTSEIVRQSYDRPTCPFCRRRFTNRVD